MKSYFFLLTALAILLVGCTSASKNSNTSSVNTTSTSNTNTTIELTTSLTTETWQIQGAGHSYETATTVVPDGSTLSYAFHYGVEAGDDLIGKTKFYYNPTPSSSWRNGIRPANSNSTTTTVAALSQFEPSNDGVKVVCDQMNLADCSTADAYYMTASQAIPLQNEQKIRLFFEAKDLSEPVTNGPPPTQIFSIDSQDGYVGEDFNSGTSSVCGGQKSTDYMPGGDCVVSLVIAASDETGLSEVRQFKIGYPVLDDWRWDEAPGTFMVITGADRCQQTRDGLFYAVFDGSTWQVQKDDAGCAKTLVPHAHGPVMVNLGDGLYKMYYEDIMTDADVGRVTKPLRFITADAKRTGDPAVVDFDDWDSYQVAGEVDFLWPDGTQLTAEEESGLGDHFIYTPDGLDSRVMYLNLGGFDNQANPQMPAGLGIAVPIE